MRFNIDKLRFAISTVKQNKDPGLYLMDIRMMKAIQKENFGLLLRPFNACGSLGIFTDRWEAEVAFFVKKIKGT